MSASAPAALRAALLAPGVVAAPSIFDGLSLRAVERAGFRAAHLSGSAAAASMLALPDIGLVSMTETLDHARRLAGASSIPLIADGDTGYGDAPQVARLVAGLEAAGVAAVHLEDQGFPKRCGFLPGRSVVRFEEFAERLDAALEARASSDFLVIARTDAFDLEGLEEAARRANAALARGADLAFVEGITSREELEAVAGAVPGPKMLNIAGPLAALEVREAELEAAGYRLVIYPGLLVDAATRAMDSMLGALGENGHLGAPAPLLGPVALAKAMGIERWLPGIFDPAGVP